MYLLDTNVVSELRKVSSGQAAPGVIAWEKTVQPTQLFISVITLQELEIGVLLRERKAPEQGQVLRRWLDSQVRPAFASRTLAVDTAVALASAQLHVPNPKPVRDGLIAATALVHNMTVVTRNVKDFSETGAKILNPWEYGP